MLTLVGIIEVNGVARTGPMVSSFGGPETSDRGIFHSTVEEHCPALQPTSFKVGRYPKGLAVRCIAGKLKRSAGSGWWQGLAAVFFLGVVNVGQR